MTLYDLIIFLEWLDVENHVTRWDDSDRTHEDVARLYLEQKDL